MRLRAVRAGRRFIMANLDLNQTLVYLDSDVAHRVQHVLRVREGDSVELLDGLGGVLWGELTFRYSQIAVRKHRSMVMKPKQERLQLGIPLLKAGNTEFAVQKAIELGATDIFVYEAHRSTRRLKVRGAGTLLSRLVEVGREAVEQCGRCYIPSIQIYENVTTVAARMSTNPFIPSTTPGLPALQDVYPAVGQTFAAIIGPEGGLDPEEISALECCGGVQVSLGSYVLRTETAVVVAATLAACGFGWLGSNTGAEYG